MKPMPLVALTQAADLSSVDACDRIAGDLSALFLHGRAPDQTLAISLYAPPAIASRLPDLLFTELHVAGGATPMPSLHVDVTTDASHLICIATGAPGALQRWRAPLSCAITAALVRAYDDSGIPGRYRTAAIGAGVRAA